MCQEHGDDDEDEDDGGVDGPSCRLTPEVNHSLLAVSPPAAALTRSVHAPPAATKHKKTTREEKRKVALEISKEEAVQQSAVGGSNFPCRESVEEQLHLSASSVSGPPSPSEDLRNPLLFFYLC